MPAANRGKYAEGKVKTLLKKLESSNCTHHRFPDAHAGSFATVPADFMILQSGHLRVLEVKEVRHEFRLPYANFGLDQVARMSMWEAAGASAWVLVCHMPAKAWRLVPLAFFRNRQLKAATGKPLGSWVLSDFPVVSLEQAFGLMNKPC